MYRQYVNQEIDGEFVQAESTQNKKRKSTKSSTSSMTQFLNSIGKKALPSLSNSQSITQPMFNEEIITYRSLAQKEYNSVVDEEKEYNIVSNIIVINFIL